MTTIDVDGEDATFDDAVAEAVEALHDVYDEGTLPARDTDVAELVGVLAESKEVGIRRDVAQMLGMLAERYPGEVAHTAPILLERTDAPDDTVRKRVLRALGYISKSRPNVVRPGVGRLVDRLEDGNTVAVRHALWSLANVAEEDPRAVEAAVPSFVDLLESEDGEVQRHAVRAVGFVSETHPEETRSALPRLLELLESRSLHRTVGRTLVSTAPIHGERLVEELFDRIEGGRPGHREHAAWTLVPIAEEHPDLLWARRKVLVDLLRDDHDHQVQNSAAATLAALAGDRPRSDLVEVLVSVLDDEDMFVRRYACLALGDVAVSSGNRDVIRALNDARQDDVALVRDQATTLLEDVATEHADVVAEVDAEFLDSLDEHGE